MQGQGKNQQKVSMNEEKEDNLRKRWRCESKPCHEMLKILITEKK